MLPHRCLAANIDAIVDGAGLGTDDVGVSWLPLYHDMGLIGLLMTPMTHRLRPRPRRAAGLPRRDPATGCGGCRSSAARSPAGRTSRTRSRRARCAASTALDLSAWRLALNGAEPIDPDVGRGVLRRRRAARARLASRRSACTAWPRRRSRSRSRCRAPAWRSTPSTARALEHERVAAARPTGDGRPSAAAPRPHACAASSCACAIPTPAASSRDREVGELELRGDSVTPGYYRAPDVTAATLPRRLAAHRRPRLPRRRRGRGVRPDQGRDHHRRSQRVPRGGRARRGRRRRRAGRQRDRVRRSRAVGARRASSSSPRPEPTIRPRCTTRCIDKVCDAVGIPPLEVVFVAAGSLPKTSSGKLQRSACKAQYRRRHASPLPGA